MEGLRFLKTSIRVAVYYALALLVSDGRKIPVKYA
jgi:hypothetical protein